MKKIPTIFLRDFANGGKITREWNPACLRIRDGEGAAYVKWDGTACRVLNGKFYKRYDAKRGKVPPAGFEPCGEPDELTGHHPGWLPVGDGPEDQWHREAWESGSFADGTYELCGPKLQGNPERLSAHYLIPHLSDECEGFPRDYDAMAAWLGESLDTHPGMEGVVFWLDGEPFAKIKSKDFGIPWPRQGKTEGKGVGK